MKQASTETRNSRVTWSVLRAFGNSRMLRMTIFIPVLGYLILFNSRVVDFLHLAPQSFGGDQASTGHVSWHLSVSYFGLCFLAVGSAVYAVGCPAEIKQYATSVEYVAGVRPYLGDIQFARIEMTLKAVPIYGDEQKLMQSHFIDRDTRVAGYIKRDAYDPNEERQQIREGYWRDLLDLNYRYLNNCRAAARWITASSYGIGVVVLSVPTIDAFWRVFAVAFQQFLG